MAAIREALEIVDRATAPLRAVTTAFTGATSAAEMAGAAVKSAEAASTGLGEALGETTRVVREASSRMTEMGQQGAQATHTAASGVDQLTGKVKSLLATLGGFAAIRGALNLSDELSMAQTRINNITGDLAETAIVQRQIYEAAQRSRGSYQEMMNTVAGLKAQTGDTFSSIQEAAGFVELLQKQFKLAGTDATGISSTMYNLTQALSTGTLKGQDLNTVFANAPQLV